MKLDILVFAAHPDDAELACAGTLLKAIAEGKKVGIVDLTRGELGTRGSAAIRDKEAKTAATILGLDVRENLDFKDGFFVNNEPHQLAIATKIRQYQPEIVLTNALADRHPDHPRAAILTKEACFVAGLKKVVTQLKGLEQEAWRPKAVYHFIQSSAAIPDFVVDISTYWDKKIEAIKAYKSQFHDPDSEEPQTFISSPQFMRFVEARAIESGQSIGVSYGEGFIKSQQLAVKNITELH